MGGGGWAEWCGGGVNGDYVTDNGDTQFIKKIKRVHTININS